MAGKINTNTQLYCIMGNPVGQSKSPAMHNALFKNNQINAVYLAFEIENISTGVKAIRDLNIKGASITIPFKKEVFQYLDDVDHHAKKIGAVNTIVNEKGKLKGYNTDWSGAIEPLKKYNINNKKVGIIGAGGSAHAIAYGIKEQHGNLTIINRDEKKGQNLASQFDAKFLSLDKIEKGVFDILINTTPLGMHPDINFSPIRKELLTKEMVIMDIVYNPIETKLIKDAKSVGCKTIDGLAMFVYQGAQQFKLWTGIEPSIEYIKKIVIKEFNNEKN